VSIASITDARPWPYGSERRSPTRSASGAGFLAGAARVVHAAFCEYRARRAARQLAESSDHLLRDVGLSRGEIERAVRTGSPA
jgi:uncharacterized protein YjiS (DUF1127 family)